MNTDRTARTGTEAEDGVTHYAGGTANAFARALAYEVGRGAEVYFATYGATFVEWQNSASRLVIEVDAWGFFSVLHTLDDADEREGDFAGMSLAQAADVARGWLDAWSDSAVDVNDYIRHLEAADAPDLQRRLEAAGRQVHRLIHDEEIETDRICDHELAYTNLRQACVIAGIDPDELERKHAEWLRANAP